MAKGLKMNSKQLQELINASPFGEFSGYRVVEASLEEKRLVLDSHGYHPKTRPSDWRGRR